MSDEKKLKEKDLDNVNGGFSLIIYKNNLPKKLIQPINGMEIDDAPSSAVDPGANINIPDSK